MWIQFDTTIKSERMRILKRLVKRAGMSGGQFNTREETYLHKEVKAAPAKVVKTY